MDTKNRKIDKDYDLIDISRKLLIEFPQVDSLYLFGSRRFRTRSPRSDVDILVKTSGYIRPSDLRDFIRANCEALDLFLVESTRAVSVVNESYIESDDFNDLLNILSAIKFWDRQDEKLDVDIDWKFVIKEDINFAMTILPSKYLMPYDEFYLDNSLAEGTRGYIEKLFREINMSFQHAIYNGCCVLCRRLTETLIIEVYESKQLSNKIKTVDNNYKMLDGLITAISNESGFDIGRNAKLGLNEIKRVGDQAAHSKTFVAKYSDMQDLKPHVRTVVESLLRTSGLLNS